ncbi:hypothetical protein [Maritimibacter sp. DP1N21-5]|uniref:hypothetical protein n=1 Tax=Maritimibacter sp. DP1N21-5 TaxID=2836867 RepID=UPI001C48BCAD|nr:hypothetical protein [Maritimibacter sp. DP1N21-5]MBV7409442.1 hypothetical protein [Maritimibacter sp. DP1N21-5]
MIYWAGILYGVLALIAAAFQLAVALGMPWGQLTMGGRWPGRLPGVMRALAVVQAGLLVLLARIVAGASGLFVPLGPSWLIWIAVAFTGLSTLANGATPSRPERRLWGPVTTIMFLSAIYVAVA